MERRAFFKGIAAAAAAAPLLPDVAALGLPSGSAPSAKT